MLLFSTPLAPETRPKTHTKMLHNTPIGIKKTALVISSGLKKKCNASMLIRVQTYLDHRRKVQLKRMKNALPNCKWALHVDNGCSLGPIQRSLRSPFPSSLSLSYFHIYRWVMRNCFTVNVRQEAFRLDFERSTRIHAISIYFLLL